MSYSNPMHHATPGHWSVKRVIPEEAATVRHVFADDDLIATVYDLDDATPEAVANARLIAAAPDLLAALQALLTMQIKGHSLADRLQFSDEGRTLLDQSRAAIAKANPC